MTSFSGWGQRARALFSDNKGPWGPFGGSGGSGDGDKPSDPPAGPWGDSTPPKRRRGSDRPASSLDELLKRGRMGGGPPGSGGGFSFGDRPQGLWRWALIGFATLWLALSSFHIIGANETGVVMQLGRFSRTLDPGFAYTLPWPIEKTIKVNTGEAQKMELGSPDAETLMLTGDQSLIDLAYQVRWDVKQPVNYLFQLSKPQDTIKQVAESAMRAVVANVTLRGAMGPERAEIEARVQQEMQATLDSYKSGVRVLGVSLRQADPPAEVNDAFKEVTAAQQDAQTYVNNANAYALQLKQKAQGEATAFDKVYEQYKLAPGVTKRRMYYETMERVLQPIDKTIVEAPGVQSYLPLNELAKPKGAAK